MLVIESDKRALNNPDMVYWGGGGDACLNTRERAWQDIVVLTCSPE